MILMKFNKKKFFLNRVFNYLFKCNLNEINLFIKLAMNYFFNRV